MLNCCLSIKVYKFKYLLFFLSINNHQSKYTTVQKIHHTGSEKRTRDRSGKSGRFLLQETRIQGRSLAYRVLAGKQSHVHYKR